MNKITQNFQQLQQRIATAEKKYHRQPGSVKVVAASKTKSITEIRAAYDAGQHAFGENYLQEALPKMAALADLSIEWHFIGSIQSNKTKPIAENFAWVQSIESYKVARRLSEQRPPNLGPLQVCIEVNISQETTKSGIALPEVPELALAINELPNLRLRGLMTIIAPVDDVEQQRAQFKELRLACEHLQSLDLPLDTLSMGMTHDLESAIAEGATALRIGTALFGPRN